MPKNAPSIGRILTMVVFALSCFGLLLFLWLSFGGPIPLKPEGYRFSASFPEAATLAEEADVRISGVTIGKVKTKTLDKGGARTNVEMEIDERYAPIPSDTRAILRQKTLLGETYVELTPGDDDVPKLPEGGSLARSSVEPTVELDEILRIFEPETRDAFRDFTAEFAKLAGGTYGEDFNDAIGNLRGFAADGTDVLTVLDEQDAALRRLIRDTGVVFGALNEQEGALGELVVNSNNTFEATAQQQDALAETFQIFPTFLRESRLTLARLEGFSRNTRPLVNDLRPVARDLPPTVRDLGDLSPDLKDLFRELRPLIDVSRDGLPAAARFLTGARPVFRGLHTFLPELNPIAAYLNYGQIQLAQFLMSGGVALVPGSRPGGDGGPHYTLPQFAMIDGRSLNLTPERPFYSRGAAYPAPNYIRRGRSLGALESFDCEPAGGRKVNPTDSPTARQRATPCFVAPKTLWNGKKYPRVTGGRQGIWTGPPPSIVPAPRDNDGRSCRGPGKDAVGDFSRNEISFCSTTRSAAKRR